MPLLSDRGCGIDSTIPRVSEIVLDNVSKVFSGGVVAVDGVSLTIGSGEFLVLVGPSGCGKSTLLRMIAGLEEVTAGTISIGAREVTDLPPRARDIAMVFQSYALYPHMTVRQNLGYGLKVRKTSKHEIKERVARAANLYVAAFIGSPAMNLVEGEVVGGQVRFGGYAIPVPATDTMPDGRLVVGIRPEAFEDSAFAEPSLPRMDVTVEVVEELGADTHVLFSVAEPRVEVGEVRAATGEEDATMGAVEGSLFTARVDPGTAAKPAASLRLAVDPSRFHYFDRETGLRFEAGRELAAVAN